MTRYGAASAATYYGLGALTGGIGYAIAAGGGAIGGAVVKGLEVYIRERRREVSRDELLEKSQELRRLRKEWGYEEGSGEKERLDQFEKYLEFTKTETVEPSPDETDEQKKEKDELYRELRKEVGVRWGKVWRGAGKGALVGAIGGVAGEGLMHLLGLRETAQAASAVTEAAKKTAKAAKDETVNQALCDNMGAAGRQAHAMALEKGMKASIGALDAKDFVEVAGNGEGLTHIARKAIHDYIAQKGELEGIFIPNKAQLVYAEDWLRRSLGEGNKIVQLGEQFRIRGGDIATALSEAGALSTEQIDNLNKEWVGKISEKTWESINDYYQVSNPQNNFADGIISNAQKLAEQVASTEISRCAAAAAKEMNRRLGVYDKVAREAARESARKWLIAKWALAGGVAAGGYLFLKNLRKKKSGETVPGITESQEHISQDEVVKPAGPVEPVPPVDETMREPEIIMPVVAEVKRRWWRRKKPRITPEVPGEGDNGNDSQTEGLKKGDGIEKPEANEALGTGPVPERVDTSQPDPAAIAEREERRRHEEERDLQAKLAGLEVPKDLRSRSVEEENKKLEADTLQKTLREEGIMTEDFDSITYTSPDKGDGTRTVRFTNYSDYRAYLDQMTLEQRESAFVDSCVHGNIWGKVDNLAPEKRGKIYEVLENAEGGLLADTFRDQPGIDKQEVLDLDYKLRGLCDSKGALFFLPGRNVNGLPFTKETYSGMQKLNNIFESGVLDRITFPKTRITFGVPKVFRNQDNLDNYPIRIHIDPRLSEDEMKDYLIKAAERAKELSK